MSMKVPRNVRVSVCVCVCVSTDQPDGHLVGMMNSKVISEIQRAAGRRRPGSARYQPACLHTSLPLMLLLPAQRRVTAF